MASPGANDAPVVDEASRLQELNADVRNQDDLERDITRQVSLTLTDQMPFSSPGAYFSKGRQDSSGKGRGKRRKKTREGFGR